MIVAVMQRIEEQVPELAGRVSGVENLAAAAVKARALECFAVLMGETAQAAASTGGAQMVTLRFAAILAYPGGQAAAAKTGQLAGPLCEKIISALLGWRHPAAIGAARYLEWKVLGVSASGHLMNALEFEFDFYRSVA